MWSDVRQCSIIHISVSLSQASEFSFCCCCCCRFFLQYVYFLRSFMFIFTNPLIHFNRSFPSSVSFSFLWSSGLTTTSSIDCGILGIAFVDFQFNYLLLTPSNLVLDHFKAFFLPPLAINLFIVMIHASPLTSFPLTPCYLSSSLHFLY